MMIDFVLKSLFKKPATVNYPFEPMPMPPHFRGKLKFWPEKCIGCLLCVKDCPAKAIKITKVGDKKFEAEIDLGKCIYCAQCVDSCPKKALEITPEFELAQISRNKLRLTYDESGSHPTEKKPG
ncbi:MAG: 4Fe-4S binding protein [Candidatus Saganbacteria bacterium]|nr:4Fe-4S binding protein [Candidatus Saganbacteria bacterium]